MKRKLLLLTFIFMSALAAQTQTALGQNPDPALPQTFDTTYPNQTGGDIHQPANSSELQSLLTNKTLNGKTLTLGDTIELQANVAYVGMFTFPKITTGSGWIIVRTSNQAGIPPPDKRVDPSYAAVMPKLEIATTDPAVRFESAAHHYWLVGLEIRYTGTSTDPGNPNNGLVRIGDSETSIANLPSNIVIDRCYIHGNTDGETKRGVALDGKTSAVINSYISEFHRSAEESQAIHSRNTPGPLKIVNNYLEAAGENLFLGSVPTIPATEVVIPTDIEVRRNHLFKPTQWRPMPSDMPGTKYWVVKNLLEFKSARKVLVEGNILENNWVRGDQHGFAVNIKTARGTGADANNITEDVTFINNIVRHTLSGMTITGMRVGNPEIQLTQRIKVANNLFDDVDLDQWATPESEGVGGIFLRIGTAAAITIDHNTAIQSGTAVELIGGQTPNFVFTNNIMNHNSLGIKGDGQSPGTDSLMAYTPSYVFDKNIIAGAPSSQYPAINCNATCYPATLAAVAFTDPANGNYRLAPTLPGGAPNPYKNAGTDGKDIGVDQDALECAISGGCGGDVIWENKVKTTSAGNDLTKPTTETAGWNAGATSAQSISGDGYVEFSTDSATTNKMAGLNSNHVGQNYTEIDYTIGLGATGNVRIYENNTSITNTATGTFFFGTYVAGDVFRVAVESGVVKYYKNGTLLYTSTQSPGYPLVVDTSLNTPGAKITDAKLFPIDVIWKAPGVGVTINGNDLTKPTTGAAGWNAGAISAQTLSGNGYVEFSTDSATTNKMAGLNSNHVGQNYTEIDYTIGLGATGNVRIYENNTSITNTATGTFFFGTYVAGDVFRVAVESGVVKYYKNGTVLYTSTVSPSYPLVVDTSLNTPGATITNATLSGSWSN
ncbi:MAG: hypothetical protein WCF57_14950 [Pyrinomonadaceae bacterium]